MMPHIKSLGGLERESPNMKKHRRLNTNVHTLSIHSASDSIHPARRSLKSYYRGVGDMVPPEHLFLVMMTGVNFNLYNQQF